MTMSTLASPPSPEVLTRRWTSLRAHPEQARLWTSPARFRVVPAGRRSGKTELAKRYLILKALSETTYPDAWFVAAAPTLAQARRIFWPDLKALIPKWALLKAPRESDLTIHLINGAFITVMGMEEPARAEGSPLSGIILDEYANMKARIWGENIRPALADRQGWAWLIGVPEGRNHYHTKYLEAISCAPSPRTGHKEWDAFTWKSSDILPPEEIESAKNELDPLTFDQEYNASFVTFEGRAYYTFSPQLHAAEPLRRFYNPRATLIIALDFNVEPGCAVIAQEIHYTSLVPSPSFASAIASPNASNTPNAPNAPNTPTTPYVMPKDLGTVTAVLGEVWIPKNSNTEAVCRKLIQDWAPQHQGPVRLYGDITGGARKTSASKGSDWDIVRQELRGAFRGGIILDLPKHNPTERARINAMNARLLTTKGMIRMLVDPSRAPNVVRDLEGVTLLQGGSGEIDLTIEKAGLNHISSALGYYIDRTFPIHGGNITVSQEV